MLGNELVQTIIVVAVTVTYATVLNRFLSKSRTRRDQEEKRFINALSNGIGKNAISSFSDVENLYKAIRRKNNIDDDVSKDILAIWLRNYMLEVVEGCEESNSEQVGSLIAQITSYIDKAEMESPHAGLPDLERSIIRDIESYLHANNSDGVKRKLSELSTAVQLREESVSRLQSITKWSVPLSVIGLLLTVVFGVASLI